MKSSDNNLDQDRFYEITEVEEGDVWYEKPGSRYCIVGAIVQPNNDFGRFKIIKPSTTNYLMPSASDETGLYLGKALTLRPLNKKDQKKLQRKRDQFCA
ncbi:hypothetical protein LCGC14_1016920 [marine sediment metagenome]|uniref:Uncharacterized protein n=1 Tax=marine sediment metagenome TaxID=412755 RepID=A0A0F9QGT2_9ZZZZ